MQQSKCFPFWANLCRKSVKCVIFWISVQLVKSSVSLLGDVLLQRSELVPLASGLMQQGLTKVERCEQRVSRRRDKTTRLSVIAMHFLLFKKLPDLNPKHLASQTVMSSQFHVWLLSVCCFMFWLIRLTGLNGVLWDVLSSRFLCNEMFSIHQAHTEQILCSIVEFCLKGLFHIAVHVCRHFRLDWRRNRWKGLCSGCVSKAAEAPVFSSRTVWNVYQIFWWNW